ncbi:MAG TPA: hypothetical protein VMX17_15385, partial [Candidatus Glassbacteria bacterium]|nr:hypothetical protein [Candidatus Glassbacteria bacterium]
MAVILTSSGWQSVADTTPEQQADSFVESLKPPKRYGGGGGGGGSSGGGGGGSSGGGGLPSEFQEQKQATEDFLVKTSGQGQSTQQVQEPKPSFIQQQQDDFNKPYPLSISAGQGILPTKEQESTTKLSFFGATKQSFGAITDFGKIGTQGFGEYYEDIFKPFSNTNIINIGDTTIPLKQTISDSPRFEDIPRSELSEAEFTVQQRFKSGEELTTLRKPTGAVASDISRDISRDLTPTFQAK